MGFANNGNTLQLTYKNYFYEYPLSTTYDINTRHYYHTVKSFAINMGTKNVVRAAYDSVEFDSTGNYCVFFGEDSEIAILSSPFDVSTKSLHERLKFQGIFNGYRRNDPSATTFKADMKLIKGSFTVGDNLYCLSLKGYVGRYSWNNIKTYTGSYGEITSDYFSPTQDADGIWVNNPHLDNFNLLKLASLTASNVNSSGLWINSSGTKLMSALSDTTNMKYYIGLYTMSTPFDLSTLVFDSKLDISNHYPSTPANDIIINCAFSDNGKFVTLSFSTIRKTLQLML